MLAGAFEAMVGAIFLDQGRDAAGRFVLDFLERDGAALRLAEPDANPKGRLQEILQERAIPAPEYVTVAAAGPDHAREFTEAVLIEGAQMGIGTGRSKRLAQQEAARQAIVILGAEETRTDALSQSWPSQPSLPRFLLRSPCAWRTGRRCGKGQAHWRADPTTKSRSSAGIPIRGSLTRFASTSACPRAGPRSSSSATTTPSSGSAKAFARTMSTSSSRSPTPVNDSIMEMLIMIDTLNRASAGRITAVIPYYGYGRTDKKDQPRVPITARLVAKLIVQAGADRVLTVDLHAGQIQGFFDIPVDEMSAMFMTSPTISSKSGCTNPVVVSPDLGNTKRARNFAEILDAPLAIIEKRRDRQRGQIRGAESDRVGRWLPGRDRGRRDRHGRARSPRPRRSAASTARPRSTPPASTPSFPAPAVSSACGRARSREVVVTNTIALPPDKRLDKFTVLSVAPLLGETIQRIHAGTSVSTAYRATGAFQARLSFFTPE